MADNVIADPGSGGATFRTDDDGTAHWPYTKIAFGADNTQTIVGSISSNPLPVALSSTDNAVLDQIEVNTSYGDNTGGGVEAGCLRVTIANDSTGTLTVDAASWPLPTGAATEASLATVATNTGNAATALQVLDDWDESDRAAVNVISGQVGVSAGSGINDAATQRVALVTDVGLPTGTNSIGTVLAGGETAHDSSVSAADPVLVGWEARGSDGTAVTSGDAVRAISTLLGKSVVYPYALPGSTWSYASQTAVTDAADDVAKAAGAAGVRHYISSVQVINGDDDTGTAVVIKDGSTVIWQGWAEQTGGGCSAKFDPPLRGTAATAVNVANVTTGATTFFNLQGFSASE